MNIEQYYIKTLTDLEYAKYIADSRWLIELKKQNSRSCNLMLNCAFDNITISILKGDSRKQFMGILALVSL